jgi:predicted SAM-dependent methyltransferase
MFRRSKAPAAPPPAPAPRVEVSPIPAPPAEPLLRDSLSDDDFLRLAYNFVLDREPEPHAWEFYRPLLANAELERAKLLDTMRNGMEQRFRMGTKDLLLSLHLSRCDFIRSFPSAHRILDLGGTAQHDRAGAMVVMGYVHEFDELIIVDLPHDARHDIYTHSDAIDEHLTPNGPVRYQYHSMADLSRYEDSSFDLVYSGQTIEHVTEDECDTVLSEVFRVLRPGGWLYLDTPNGPVCRIQQPDFINPDHKVEYSHDEFVAKLRRAGFDVRIEQGLNWSKHSIDAGVFQLETTAWFRGVYGEPAECYLLAYGAQKPA